MFPVGWLYNFSNSVLVSFLIIVSCVIVSLFLEFTHIFIFIMMVMIVRDVKIILVDKENISFEARLVT
jgi:hypothetical protein